MAGSKVAPKELPKRENLVDYNRAVAGHAGTLCDRDGEMFIKPCTQDEINFYQEAALNHPEIHDLLPLFMGTLMLNDATDVDDINEQLPVIADHISQEMKEAVVEMAHNVKPPKENGITWNSTNGKKLPTDRAIVLENTSFGYEQPNVMDVKLGRRLWADDAPQEKKIRFDQIRRDTTHEEFGFRIAGMRTYKGSSDPSELDDEGYKIYGKDWGRLSVNASNIVDSFRKFIFNSAANIDEEYGRAIASAFKTELEHVRNVLERERTRMYSASLLFVFEGDGEALKRAIEYNNTGPILEKAKEISGRSNFRVDSGIVLDDDGELIHPTEVDDEDEDEARPPRILGLKLIDFAHAKFHPDEDGPDENLLHGVRCLIDIFGELAT